MLLWLGLFLIIVAISFLLAFQSMKDFQITPKLTGSQYALFLIKNPENLDSQILDRIYDAISKTGSIITLERLFKGSKSALVIFGPRSILSLFIDDLGLVELEEYSEVDPARITAWEVGTKDQATFHLQPVKLFQMKIDLNDSEQFWWQLTMQANPGQLWPDLNAKKGFLSGIFSPMDRNYEMNLRKMAASVPGFVELAKQKNQQKTYQSQIRAVIISSDKVRRESLAKQLESIDGGKLVKLPRPYTSAQILSTYQKRSRIVSNINTLILTTDELLQLSGV